MSRPIIAAVGILAPLSPALPGQEPGPVKMLRKEVVVAAPPEQLWRDWTTREGLAAFFRSRP